MKVSFLGGGAWGISLAQVLVDNGNEVVVYDINTEFIDIINNEHIHPFFENHKLPEAIKGVKTLKEAIDFANVIVLSTPTKVTRSILKDVNNILNEKKIFVNVSKGIEPNTSKRVSEIVYEEIDEKYIEGFAVLTGPSHAEEVIERMLTCVVSASTDEVIAKKIQLLFSNNNYLRIYTSNDLIGCEIAGAIKNAIALVSGVSTGLGLGENARAALISRGVLEIVRIVEAVGGCKETAYGLAGVGDLIVTASSENSRNFRAGKKIGQGQNVDEVVVNSVQTVEGVRTIIAAHELGEKYNIDLPIINAAYDVLYGGLEIKDAIPTLLDRALKKE